jgi:Tetratricopeptide repeat
LNETEKLEVDVMELRKWLLGAAHPDTLASMANLTATYSQQQRQNEAETLNDNIEQIGNSKKKTWIQKLLPRRHIRKDQPS